MAGESCLFVYPFVKHALNIYLGTVTAEDNEDLGSALRLLSSPVEELVK